MSTRSWAIFTALAGLAVLPAPAGHDITYAQGAQTPGRSIGTISTEGDLIVMTLNEGALGSANPFDLGGRTLRFTPGAGGYRGENRPVAVGRGVRVGDVRPLRSPFKALPFRSPASSGSSCR